jgi:cobalt-zinc-cadmium efflux system outer membrane protein
VIRRVGITRFAANGATTAVLWLSPAMAGDQTLPGATVESVVAIAKRLNPTVVAASLEVELQTKYAEMERLAGGSL